MSRKESTKDRSANREVWILGSGTAALASALYLVRIANLPPHKVHILDSHGSLGQALHHRGDHTSGYDQFAGCLPVPVGEPLKQLLALVPSVRGDSRSVFDEIETAESNRISSGTGKKNGYTRFLVQRNGELSCIPTKSLNLSIRQRLALVRLLFKRETDLQRKQIRDYLSRSFFRSTFWVIWSAQFGFQPWHSASEFRRTIKQYMRDFHGLAILSCLEVTGRYQFEATFLPIYHFLRSLDVDFRFDARVKDVHTSVRQGDTKAITRIDLVENGFELRQPIRGDDLVIVTLGSTVSGCTTGTEHMPPFRTSMQAIEALDENWSLWLELEAKHQGFGDPYNFCTHQGESIVESFTVTTEDLEVWEHLCALSSCPPYAGAFIALQESPWRMNLCLPAQPVFSEQPSNVRVFWGFANFPESKGKFVQKAMLRCSGAEIMDELLRHLHMDPRHLMRRTVTIPRVMPLMSAILLPRAVGDRPVIIPQSISNLGLVGQFCEMPRYSCVDMSYSVRTAQKAVSQLTGEEMEQAKKPGGPRLSTFLKILFWR
ncbi:oleate hydratase [Aspergillus varians]